MPMRAYRASTAYAGAHITNNMWLSIIVSAGLMAVVIGANWMDPRSNIWGHLIALAGMVCGTLIMIQSQVGYVSPYAVDDAEDGDGGEVLAPPMSSVPRQ